MVQFVFIVPIVFCLVYITEGISRLDPLVDTGLGVIRGLPAPDGDYAMFLGIPYAVVGPLNPFGVSTPHPGFNDTYDAIDDSTICPQVEYFTNTIGGTLDCLQLNIYVPNSANSKNRFAVLVWFHGGAFSTGFAGRAFYGPKFLVRKDIILVTVNYRLGPYGFFCLNTSDVPGNQGLKDQLIALQWVKKNIEAYGGISDSITIFGESAGGSSVDHHLIYGNDDLFDKVIIQSASAISPFSLSEPDLNAPLKIAEHLGHKSTDIEDALNFLTGVNTDVIILAVTELGLQFRPCVEGKFKDVEQLISDYPINMNIPQKKRLPLLIGYNNNEALFSHWSMAFERLKTLIHDNLKNYFNFDDEYLRKMVDIVHEFYIGDDDVNETRRQDMIDFISDIRYVHPIHTTIQKHIDDGTSKVYHYVFSYEGNRNLFKARNNMSAHGAAHTDELGYLFDVAVLNEPISPEDQLVIDKMTTLWTNFAKYSNPTPQSYELLPVEWLAVTGDALHYLEIGSELRVKKRPFFNRMAFWDLFYTLNKEFHQGYKSNS